MAQFQLQFATLMAIGSTFPENKRVSILLAPLAGHSRYAHLIVFVNTLSDNSSTWKCVTTTPTEKNRRLQTFSELPSRGLSHVYGGYAASVTTRSYSAKSNHSRTQASLSLKCHNWNRFRNFARGYYARETEETKKDRSDSTSEDTGNGNWSDRKQSGSRGKISSE